MTGWAELSETSPTGARRNSSPIWCGPGIGPAPTAMTFRGMRPCGSSSAPNWPGGSAGAVRYFTTQLIGPDPVLSPSAIERLTRPYEVLLGQ